MKAGPEVGLLKISKFNHPLAPKTFISFSLAPVPSWKAGPERDRLITAPARLPVPIRVPFVVV